MQGYARPCKAMPGQARPGQAKQSKAKQSKTKLCLIDAFPRVVKVSKPCWQTLAVFTKVKAIIILAKKVLFHWSLLIVPSSWGQYYKTYYNPDLQIVGIS
jgi:hypothetical protein